MKEIHPKKSLSLLTLIFRSINLNEKVIKTSIIVLILDQNGSIQRMITSGRDLGRLSKMAGCRAPKEQAAAHPAQQLISQVNVPSLDATLESARYAPPKGYMIKRQGFARWITCEIQGKHLRASYHETLRYRGQREGSRPSSVLFLMSSFSNKGTLWVQVWME